MKPQCVVCMNELTSESSKKTQMQKDLDHCIHTCFLTRENTLQIWKYLLNDKD